MRVLVLYATRRNSTAEVAQYISNILEESQLEVTTANVEAFEGDIGDFDAYVVGTGIYNGMWAHPLLEKLRLSKEAIGQKPVWGFGLCIRVLEEEGEFYAQQNYMPDFVVQYFNLQEFRFIAGKFFLQDIDMEERWTLSIRYDGQIAPETYNKDYRDWDNIGQWGRKVATSIVQVLES